MASVRHAERIASPPRPVELAAPGVAADLAQSLARELMVDRDAYLAFVRRRVRSGAYAEDIVQQALVKATAHAADVRDPARRRAWFFQILRRTLADHLARWAAREATLETLGADVDVDVEAATPEEVATCACSLSQLARLRADYADILRRVDIEEQSLLQVASALSISINNATVRLHRARKALREQMRAFCGTDTARACADCGCDD